MHYQKNNEAIVRFLIENGADVNVGDKNGIAKYLIEKDADINAISNTGDNAVTCAVNRKNIDFFRFLLEYNPDITIMNTNLETPLNIAINDSLIDIVKVLLDYSEDKGISILDEPILIHSIKLKAFKTARDLASSSNVNELNSLYNSPLCYAVIAGDIETIKVLLDNGALINSTNFDEKTALHFAYSAGNDEIVSYLIKNGINEKEIDYYGKIASMYSPNKLQE